MQFYQIFDKNVEKTLKIAKNGVKWGFFGVFGGFWGKKGENTPFFDIFFLYTS